MSKPEVQKKEQSLVESLPNSKGYGDLSVELLLKCMRLESLNVHQNVHQTIPCLVDLNLNEVQKRKYGGYS